MKELLPQEIRIIASLIEKEYTTPEYYPMTINSLTNACNQKSNRDPVVLYTEKFVEEAVDKMNIQSIITKVTSTEYRVPKYKQRFTVITELSLPETAVLCILMLRGPQTIGEIKGRCARIFDFPDLKETEETLDALIKRGEKGMVVKLPRQPGRDARYVHRLSGDVSLEEYQSLVLKSDKERVASLEEEVEFLKSEIESLKSEFANFRNQFE